MQNHFYQLADELAGLLHPSEIFTCYFEGEDSDFVRFNRTRVRQAGTVHQATLSLDLIEGERHAMSELCLTGDLDADRRLLVEAIEQLRAQRRLVASDPYLLYATEVHDSQDIGNSRLPDSHSAVGDIVRAAEGLDLVGVYAAGTQYRGFANSLGQRNWHARATFNLDWSCHLSNHRAVKGSYAGFEWDADVLTDKMDAMRSQLATLSQAPRELSPGGYRAYLAPMALREILEMVSYGGFGLKSHRTRQTPLIKMIHGDRTLHPAVNMSEAIEGSLAPAFTPEGFMCASTVALIRQGRYADSLVDPRSAREYDVAVNAGDEVPEALTLDGGRLPSADILARLDNGLYIGNLWYCNFSDLNDCRLTGMTRYACFWVENGRLGAPIDAMRFDDSVYRILGDKLLELTQERELLLSPDTYHQRSSASMCLPGALTDELTLTL